MREIPVVHLLLGITHESTPLFLFCHSSHGHGLHATFRVKKQKVVCHVSSLSQLPQMDGLFNIQHIFFAP